MSDNFRAVLTHINVEPLLLQLDEHPDLWNTDGSRTSIPGTVHHDVDDIILRYNTRGDNWNCLPFSVLNDAQPIVFQLMARVWGELLGRVIISRLPPGRIIPTHTDRLAHGQPMFFQRYQIPLRAAPGVEFHIEDEQMFLEPSNIYWIANTKEHSVINNSPIDRISMVVDIRTFTPL